ncbi:mCG1047632 [Mus musculus]|nr:mCG1047632 [Mus musculus]
MRKPTLTVTHLLQQGHAYSNRATASSLGQA